MAAAAQGNPHATHALGIQGRYQIEAARQQIMAVVGPGKLIFTSGATEANSMAILGMALRELRRKGKRRKVITCTTEHASILDLKGTLRLWGFELCRVPVLSNGRIHLDRLERELDGDTLMLSVMTVNNETGVTQPWDEIQALAGRVTVHTDAAQAMGKVDALPQRADLITLSSHKVHGPKGIGALLIRRGPKPDALIRGGGQQEGLRSGTEPTALCIGFGACLEISCRHHTETRSRIHHLSARLMEGIKGIWPGSRRIGEHCVDGIVCMHLPGVHAGRILSEMPRVAASTGSACDAQSDRISHVLRAMRVREGRSCLRMGISRMTTVDEIDGFLDQLGAVHQRLIG